MKKKKKSHLILKSFLLVFAVYSIFNIITLRTKISEKQKDIDAIQGQIYAQQVANQQLLESIQFDLSDEEIANIARQRLGYALPGERVFIDITGK